MGQCGTMRSTVWDNMWGSVGQCVVQCGTMCGTVWDNVWYSVGSCGTVRDGAGHSREVYILTWNVDGHCSVAHGSQQLQSLQFIPCLSREASPMEKQDLFLWRRQGRRL